MLTSCILWLQCWSDKLSAALLLTFVYYFSPYCHFHKTWSKSSRLDSIIYKKSQPLFSAYCPVKCSVKYHTIFFLFKHITRMWCLNPILLYTLHGYFELQFFNGYFVYFTWPLYFFLYLFIVYLIVLAPAIQEKYIQRMKC